MTAVLRRLRRYQGSLAVLIIGTLLIGAALRWMGYPLEALSTAFIGQNGDTFANSWAIHQAIDNLLHRPTDLGYSTIFYGEVNSFSYTIAPYGIAVAVLPVYLLSGGNLVLTYNLYWIGTFVLTGWAVYLLVRYLLDAPRGAAVIAGLMAAFAQFRFLHVGHVETLSMQFYLLGLYCLHRLLDSPRRRWALALAAAIWFTLLTSGYLGSYLIVTGAALLGYVLFRERSRLTPELVRMLLLAALIGGLACAPFLAMRLGNRPQYTYNEFVFYSATPRDWFLGTSQIYSGVLPYRDEVTLFLGFTPLALAGAAWFYRKRLVAPAPQNNARFFTPLRAVTFYGMLTLAGYVLTLGPVLRFTDQPVMPLPYLLFMQIPWLGALRVPARFIILAITGTAILSACTLTLLSRRTDRFSYRSALAIVAGLLLMELTPFNGNPSKFLTTPPTGPGPLSAPTPSAAIPPVYIWLKAQPPGTPIFQYPDGNAVFTYFRYQPYHGQPMLNGYGSLFPAWYVKLDWATFPNASMLQFLADHGIRYVLIHNEFLSADQQAAVKGRLAAPEIARRLILVDTFDTVDVYRLSTGQ